MTQYLVSPEDQVVIKEAIARRVEESSKVQDPVYSAMLAAYELECWLEKSREQLQLYDQRELSLRAARHVRDACRRLKELFGGTWCVRSGAQELGDMHRVITADLGPIGFRRTP